MAIRFLILTPACLHCTLGIKRIMPCLKCRVQQLLNSQCSESQKVLSPYLDILHHTCTRVGQPHVSKPMSSTLSVVMVKPLPRSLWKDSVSNISTHFACPHGCKKLLTLDESPSRLHQVIYDHNMTPFWVPLLELNNPLVSISHLVTYNHWQVVQWLGKPFPRTLIRKSYGHLKRMDVKNDKACGATSWRWECWTGSLLTTMQLQCHPHPPCAPRSPVGKNGKTRVNDETNILATDLIRLWHKKVWKSIGKRPVSQHKVKPSNKQPMSITQTNSYPEPCTTP